MPKLRTEAPVVAELVPMIDATGRNVAVVIVKATYVLGPDGAANLSEKQEPLSFVDQQYDSPDKGDIWWPSDLTDHKPATDILFLRPSSQEADRLRGRPFSLSVGPVRISGKMNTKWEFGPVRRDQEPRKSLAGTYDEAWVRERMPILPVDFDPRYNQTAPPAQIAKPYLVGDEPLSVNGVYDDVPEIRGRLPQRAVVIVGSVLSDYFTEVAPLDTVEIWADRPQLALVWRYVIRPRQKIEEIGNVHVNFVRLKTARELYGAP